MRQISRRMEIIHPKIGWRRDEHGTHKHAHGSWILWSVSRVRSKTMHSLFCITSWLPYITLCYIDSRFFLPLGQSRMALLGFRLAASRLREAARWQLVHIQTNTNKRSCCFCRQLRFLYSFLTAVSDSYLNCHQEYKIWCKTIRKNAYVAISRVTLRKHWGRDCPTSHFHSFCACVYNRCLSIRGEDGHLFALYESILKRIFLLNFQKNVQTHQVEL